MAAGKGSRMYPLSQTVPKPLLKVAGKTLVEHNIDPIYTHFDEIIFIVKYKHEMFREYFGNIWNDEVPIKYIIQETAPWTGWAILALKGHISGEFVVISGDDLYDSEDILRLSKNNWYATLCKPVKNPEEYGIFYTDENGKAKGIVEKPTDTKYGNLASIWSHKFDDAIFEELEQIPLSPRWELEITDLIDIYIQQGKYHVITAEGRWIPAGYPWNLLDICGEIVWNFENTIDRWADIEPNVYMHGDVYLDEGVILKSGTYIEWNVYIGKNSVIGPNVSIRGNTSIWKNCLIRQGNEIKNSVISDNTNISHLCYVWDSVLWNHVKIWGGTKTANWRHDDAHIKVKVKGELIDTGRRKMGAIIGDNTHTGINTSIYPGRILPNDSTTLPWENVQK